MREITSHKVNPANDVIKIQVTDEAGVGGANHRYVVSGYNASANLSRHYTDDKFATAVLFQNGPIAENGVNGVTQEVLLAIVIDRLQSFQKGPFACRENALALTKLEEAKHWLFSRTLERMQRGVEGTTAK